MCYNINIVKERKKEKNMTIKIEICFETDGDFCLLGFNFVDNHRNIRDCIHTILFFV